MYLKRIELEGFKSFADRTVIPVERGLTGIVGPNGCGKSNVVDALLWVMGERSSKALRADAMDDVIFKGAEGRKGAPYAMVEVVLGDPDGRIVEPGGEVAVGRRLFATGEAEYLLHGRKVRRKDVREVLLDTGLGVRGYMVLAQGKIDAVLAANPDERRSVFEEAAGISRYKTRKHETVLKLKRVDQDLARAQDVLDEVSRSVRSLKIQAGKARRFLETRDRYRELRIRLAFADSASLREGENRHRSEQEGLDQRIDGLKRERDEVAGRLAELEREESVLRERHDALRGEASSVQERAAGLEERVHGLETRASEGESRIQRDRQRLDSLQGEKQADAEADSKLQQEHAQRTSALEQAKQVLAEAETAFTAAQGARTELRQRMEELRREVLQSLQERTQWNNRIAEAAKRRSEAEGGLKALQRRREELAGEGSGVDGEVAQLQAEHQRLQESATVAERADHEAKERVEAAQDRRKGFSATAHAARQRQAAAEARMEAFKVVDDEMPGVPEHLRRFIEEEREGVGGWLLEELQIEQPWDRLLENLLGRLQHAFWLQDTGAAEGLSDGLFDFFFATQGESPQVPLALEGARPLRMLLSGNDAACDALCARLGAVFCVDDAEEARRLAAKHGQALFISKDGELHGRGYSRRGILSEDAAGLLARRNGREQAMRQLQEAEAEFERAHALEEKAAAELMEAEGVAESCAQTAREQRAQREEVAGRLKSIVARQQSLSEESRAIEAENTSLAEVVEQTTAQEQEATAKRDAVEQRRLQSNQELEDRQGEVDACEARFEQASQGLQESRGACRSLEHEDRVWRNRHAELVARCERQEQERGELETEITTLETRCRELRAEAEQAREERSTLLEKRVQLSERVEEAATQLQRASEGLQGVRARSQDESGRLESLLGQRQELALEVQRLQMQGEELIRGVLEEFGQGMEELARGMAIDAQQPLGELVLEEVREEVGGLKRRIESIGSVNLDAVEELEERQQREEFLLRERDDLTEAKGNLEATLEELDLKCRERFVETFERVQTQFEHIFRRLFRGGRASIQLEADSDPLEAGIEITVRPPGKELRSINLLSGGERTLTALALLLAVFQSRPSPFCLLDEVDAALDDANVERFVDVLNDFTGTTQFLVVTHNRITMARCERLFGVTMRKRGVSMVVSVEMDQLAEEGEMDLSQATAVDPARERGVAARRGVVGEVEMEAS